MALDTAHKRGAAMLLALPFRPWLAVPTGTIGPSSRLSLVWLGSVLVGAFTQTLTGTLASSGGLPRTTTKALTGAL